MFQDIMFKQPIIRVNNREDNIEFFNKTLGLRLKSEENSIAELTDFGNRESYLTIEESPSYRTRACKGLKKLNKISIFTKDNSSVMRLLQSSQQVTKIYKGINGYAFECLSPEQDTFLLHSEEDVTNLVLSDYPVFEDFEGDFRGLLDFSYKEITLNVLDEKESFSFYQALLPESLVSMFRFSQSEGDDLNAPCHETWDIEILEFVVGSDTELRSIKEQLVNQGKNVYLDKKERLLVVTDPSGIELWFQKK